MIRKLLGPLRIVYKLAVYQPFTNQNIMVLRTLLFKFTLKFIIPYLLNDVNERLINKTFDYIIIRIGFFSDRIT